MSFNLEIHPCDDVANYKKCCHSWTEKIGNNLKAIMNVMRFAAGRGKSRLKVDGFLERVLENLQYSVKNLTVDELDVVDYQTLIPWCDLNQQKGPNGIKMGIESCNLFEPVVTDMGLCHARLQSYSSSKTFNSVIL